MNQKDELQIAKAAFGSAPCHMVQNARNSLKRCFPDNVPASVQCTCCCLLSCQNLFVDLERWSERSLPWTSCRSTGRHQIAPPVRKRCTQEREGDSHYSPDAAPATSTAVVIVMGDKALLATENTQRFEVWFPNLLRPVVGRDKLFPKDRPNVPNRSVQRAQT